MTSILLDKKPETSNAKIMKLSDSKIKCFDKCAKQYKYIYIEKLPRKDSIFTYFGKYLHKVLELFHEDLLKDPSLNLLELMSTCQDKAFEEWGSKLSLEQRQDAYDLLQKYLTKYQESLKCSKQTKILSLEKEFFISIDDKILLNGYIDLIKLDPDGIYSVEDYKSSQKKKYVDGVYSGEDYKFSEKKKYLKKDQLLLYAYVIYMMFPNVTKVRGKYIMLCFDFQTIDFEFSLKEILSVEQKLLDYANKIEEEKLFRANPTPLCPYCPAYDICPDKWIKHEKKIAIKIDKTVGECDW